MVSAVRSKLGVSFEKIARKTDVRTQFGALCYRMRKGKPQVLLITSRDTGRWIIPKGWPMKGETAHEAAAIEAWEEAGVKGEVHPGCTGIYSYRKIMDEKTAFPVVVAVYPLRVSRLMDDFPEAGQRKRKWFEPKKAGARVVEPELRQLLKHFDPVRL